MSKKKKYQVGHAKSIAERLEIIKARQHGLSKTEIYQFYGVAGDTQDRWLQAYERNGVAGLEQLIQRTTAARTSAKVLAAEPVVAQVLQADPTAGVGKVQGALYRRGFLALARETVRQLLRRQGHPARPAARPRNKPKVTHFFERAHPNDLWQTDILTFMLKGQYRVYLIGFLDDHSRFLVGWGLHRFQTAAHVLEVFRAALEKHGAPKEVLSDNGRQYYSWAGKSQFTTLLTKLGIRHIRSRPYHPQTLGKIESFWRNLIQECLGVTPVVSFEDAQAKLGEYIEYYNFKRPHQGIGQVVPADRFFQVEGQVRQLVTEHTAQVAATPAPLTPAAAPAYLVGNLGGKELRVIAREAIVSLTEGKEGSHASPAETPQSAGTLGAPVPRPEPSDAGHDALPTGGGVADALLPLAPAAPAGGLAGLGSASPGAETPAPARADAGSAPCAPPAPRAGSADAAAGTGSPAAGGSGGDADHSAPGVGPAPEGT